MSDGDGVVLVDPDLATVRARIAAWTPEVDTRDLQLAVTEVVANAHRHGVPPVEVVLRAVGGQPAVTVRDRGHGPAGPAAAPQLPPASPQLPAADAERGRGRWLAAQLAVVEERRTPRGYEVTITHRAATAPGPSHPPG